LFGLIAAVGLRLSGALHLRHMDVDLQSATLTVRQTKFNKSGNAVGGVFPGIRLRPKLVALADVDAAAARRTTQQFGFERDTTDWRSLLAEFKAATLAMIAAQARSSAGTRRA
jgi:hypothetical protein